MKIIAIDQSICETGVTYDTPSCNGLQFALLNTKAEKGKGNHSVLKNRRISKILKGIEGLCIEGHFNLGIIEGFSFGSTGKAIFDLGGLGHSIRMLFDACAIDYFVVPPGTLKKWFTGKGNANKDAMALKMVKYKFPIPEKNYGSKRAPLTMLNDNLVDSTALYLMATELIAAGSVHEYWEKVEKSWDI